MKCPKCGALVPDGSNFCLKCGSKMTAAVAEPQPKGQDESDPDDLSKMEELIMKSLEGNSLLLRAESRRLNRALVTIAYCFLLVGCVMAIQPTVAYAFEPHQASTLRLALAYFGLVAPIPIFFVMLLTFAIRRPHRWEQDKTAAGNVQNTSDAIVGVMGLFRGYVKSKRYYEASMLAFVAGTAYLATWTYYLATLGIERVQNPTLALIGLAALVVVLVWMLILGYRVGREYKPAMYVSIVVANAYYTQYTGPEQYQLKKRDKILSLIRSIFMNHWKWF